MKMKRTDNKTQVIYKGKPLGLEEDDLPISDWLQPQRIYKSRVAFVLTSNWRNSLAPKSSHFIDPDNSLEPPWFEFFRL